jgi:hypothetical protein
MIKHQDRILAIKEKVKPGFFSIYTVPFDKPMLKSYLMRVKVMTIEPDGTTLKK